MARPPHESILPLENGDRLTRKEFERRYQAMSHQKKAERIEGVGCMGSPVPVSHRKFRACIMAWLGNYWTATPGVQTVRLDGDNKPQQMHC